MVRLEGAVNQVVKVILAMFQFQDGAIRRGYGTVQDPLTLRFQFQDGAIRRRHTYTAGWNQVSFNSKMVRLEAVPVGEKKRLFSRLSEGKDTVFFRFLSSTLNHEFFPGYRRLIQIVEFQYVNELPQAMNLDTSLWLTCIFQYRRLQHLPCSPSFGANNLLLKPFLLSGFEDDQTVCLLLHNPLGFQN
jgi:hypothetical protein